MLLDIFALIVMVLLAAVMIRPVVLLGFLRTLNRLMAPCIDRSGFN